MENTTNITNQVEETIVAEHHDDCVTLSFIQEEPKKAKRPDLDTYDPKNFNLKVSWIQTTLNAPKDKYNSFGQYYYRSAEGILAALKPLLYRAGLVLTIHDEIIPVGSDVYVKATAMLTDGQNAMEVSAYAKEPKDKKGMDSAQITGATSSYARKYALNGMFCIDDIQDADTNVYNQTT